MDEQFVCLICCRETGSSGVWSCHVELEVDCRIVGRWFGKNCKRQSSQSRCQHGQRFAVSVNPHGKTSCIACLHRCREAICFAFAE